MQLSPVAARVLGCLVEKGRTTPDQYPLSLNALVNACNQSTNRWPVVRYDDDTVEAGLDELREHGLVRREKPHGGRAIKYSQNVARVLPVPDAELALLCVLLLRGAQTPGELKARTERLHAFADLDAVLDSLRGLADHEDGALVEQLPREPGRKEARWQDLLQAHGLGDVAGVTDDGADATSDEALPTTLAARVASLEAEMARLVARLDALDGLDARREH